MRRVLAVVSFLILLVACEGGEWDWTPISAPVTVVEYGSIEGVVKLSDGGVASDIDVRLARVESSCMFCGPLTAQYHDVDKTRADDEGTFEFPRVRAGSYAIFLGAYEGYSGGGPGDPQSFTVSPDRVASVTRVLVPKP